MYEPNPTCENVALSIELSINVLNGTVRVPHSQTNELCGGLGATGVANHDPITHTTQHNLLAQINDVKVKMSQVRFYTTFIILNVNLVSMQTLCFLNLQVLLRTNLWKVKRV